MGAYFADACRMEAASVPAFVALRDELLMYGAPAELVARAERAKQDEVRHTRITAALARRFGAQEGAWAEPPEVTRANQRSLEAIALENAVEGCVNEAYAALVATWQGEHAVDPSVRAAMRAIAEDERQHAELAYSVANWIDTKLDEDTRRRVDEAIERATCGLVRSISPFSPELVEAGLAPTPGEQANLIDSLLSTLETTCLPS
jgi:rubrerythrin